MGWTPARIAGIVLFTVVVSYLLVIGGRALLASDEDPIAGLAEQAVYQRLVVLPEDADIVIEPAWAATFYGTVLIRPEQADSLLPGGEFLPGGGDSNDPAFSYQQYTTEGEWTCLAYVDLHDADHPSPLIAVEQLESERRAAIESGERVLANVGTICGTEDQFPNR
ncbi:MAG: hypothetical protein QNJ88_16155 [Acidimicrobiia bacterium]|nr:hypothetical protein [Acidimicrobiia bacterium]